MDERKKRQCDAEAPTCEAGSLSLARAQSPSKIAEILTSNLIWNYMKKNNVTDYELM